jgi:hypothetical protein
LPRLALAHESAKRPDPGLEREYRIVAATRAADLNTTTQPRRGIIMSGFNHLRAAVAGAVLTALAATACDTATAGPEDDPGVTEPFEELTRIYPPTNIPRIYPPTDLYVPADRTGD